MEILNSAIGVGLDIILLLYMMKNYKYKFDKIYILGYCLAYMISVIVLNKVMGSGIFRLPIYCFLVWLFIMLFYEETTALLAVKLTVIYFVIMQVSEMFMLGCIILLGDYSLYEEALQGDFVRTILIILITKSISMIFAMLLGRLRSKKQQYIVSIAILFPLLIALLVLIINAKLLLEIKNDRLVINIICTTGLIMFVAMSYAMFFEYYEKAKEREKFIEKLVLQNKQQYKLFQEKMLNDQKIKKMYHDMKNHVLYLQYCFINKDLEKGLSYSNNLLNQLSACHVFNHTGNGMLDCLISEMIQKCKETEITFEMDINLPGQCFMSDFDICTLFGNILSNAYEATMRLDEHKNKPIIFKMSIIDNFLVIKVTNHTLIHKKGDPNIFLTSKLDKANHRFGLRNIDDVIKKYGGIKKISVDIDVFTMMIMIPIP